MPTGKIVPPPQSAFTGATKPSGSTSEKGFFVKVTDPKPENHPKHKKDDVVFVSSPNGIEPKPTDDVLYEVEISSEKGSGKNPVISKSK